MAKTENENEALTGKKLVKKTKAETAGTRTVKAKTKSRKSKTQEQIEQLEKALEKVNEENVMDLLPEEVKADIEADQKENAFENETMPDVEKEIKEMFDKAEPSEELKEQIVAFETGKEEFNKKLEKNPSDAEKTIKAELKRVEKIKKQVEKMQQTYRKLNEKDNRRESFTNIWNGMGYDL